MNGPAADGYEVRSRLEARRSWRGRFVTLLAAAAIVLWAGSTLLAPPNQSIARSTARPASESSAPIDSRATFPADVQMFASMRSEIVPTLTFNGPEWLDASRPHERMSAHAGIAEWAFIWADGTAACICHEPGQAGSTASRHIAWFDRDGRPTASEPLEGWPNVGENRVVTAVAWDPTAPAFYLAWGELLPTGWTVRLQLRDAMGGGHATVTVASEVFAEAPLGTSVGIAVEIAPDGRRARVELALAPFEPISDSMRRWIVPIEGATFGSPRLGQKAADADGDCAPLGWATNDEYLELCNRFTRSGEGVTVLLREAWDGRLDRLEIEDAGPVDWIIDQTRGRLFVWQPGANRLVGIDVARLAFGSRSSPELGADATFAPEAPWPSPVGEQTIWAPRGAGRFEPEAFQGTPGVQPRTLVGSRDGRVIYTIGFRADGGFVDESRSSGIWAFDADTLGLIGHWDPAGEYDELAMTPDGAYVIAIGGPLQTESFGNHGRTIAFHDARTGELGLVLRNDVSGVAFLVPEPSP